MNIIGNVQGSNGVLVVSNRGVELINSTNLYNKLYQCSPSTLVSVVYADEVREVRANLALNKTGLISKRWGTPLLIKSFNQGATTGPCVINGKSIGNCITITVESYEDTSAVCGYLTAEDVERRRQQGFKGAFTGKVGDPVYNTVKGWVKRTIHCFPELNTSFNYTGKCEDIGLLFSNLKVFRISKEVTEAFGGWKYAALLDDSIQLISMHGYTLQNFLNELEIDGIIKTPVLNLAKKRVCYEEGTCFSAYAKDLDTAWLGEEGLTCYQALKKGNAYKIILFKDYDKTAVKYSAVLTVDKGVVYVSDVVLNT